MKSPNIFQNVFLKLSHTISILPGFLLVFGNSSVTSKFTFDLKEVVKEE